METIFRKSKITPKKVGQFATIYKRPYGYNVPFDSNDSFDYIVIESADEKHRGQFKFDKKILIEQGIITHGEVRGKMGIRVYPPWTKPTAKQAIKSQQWQLLYFT